MKKFLLFGFVAISTVILSLSVKADLTVSKGTYYGLFYETNGTWHHSSGIITISTTTSGSYSARLQIGFDRYRFSSHFNSDGHSSVDLHPFSGNRISIELQIDQSDSDLITGTVSTADWDAELFADRAVFNKNNLCPDQGKYTMAVPGDFSDNSAPGGASTATIKVDKKGRGTISAEMADGSRFTMTTYVSKAGQVPMYAPLYFDHGSVYSWLQLNGAEDSDVSGVVTWIKRENHFDWNYPDGFSLQQNAIGSRYVPPPHGSVDISAATLEFNGGNDRSFTNHITIDERNRVHNDSDNRLGMSFSTSSGSFGGSVRVPDDFDSLGFRGVVLQKENFGLGHFFDRTKVGEVRLVPE
jgi:hypothetical protein